MSFWNKIGIVSKKDYDNLCVKIEKLEELNEKLILQQSEMTSSFKVLSEKVNQSGENIERKLDSEVQNIIESMEKKDANQMFRFNEIIDNVSIIKQQSGKIEEVSGKQKEYYERTEKVVEEIRSKNEERSKEIENIKEDILRKITMNYYSISNLRNELEIGARKINILLSGQDSIINHCDIIKEKVDDSQKEIRNSIELNIKDELEKALKNIEGLLSYSEYANNSFSNIENAIKKQDFSIKDINRELLRNSGNVSNNKNDIKLMKKNIESIDTGILDLENMMKILWINGELNNLDRNFKKKLNQKMKK